MSDDEIFEAPKPETHRSLEPPPPRPEIRAVNNANKRRWSTDSSDNQKVVTSSKAHKLQRRVSEVEGMFVTVNAITIPYSTY